MHLQPGLQTESIFQPSSISIKKLCNFEAYFPTFIALHVLIISQCLHLKLQPCLCDTLSIAVCSAVQPGNIGAEKLWLPEHYVIGMARTLKFFQNGRQAHLF